MWVLVAAKTDGYLVGKKLAISFFMPRRMTTMLENDSHRGLYAETDGYLIRKR